MSEKSKNNIDFNKIDFNFKESKPLKDLPNAFSYVGMFGGVLGFNLVVYKLTNLHNGKLYFGQSNNLLVRMMNHKADLQRGKHTNKELQQDYDDLREDISLGGELQQNNKLNKLFLGDKDPIINSFSCELLYNKLINFEKNIEVIIHEVLKTLIIEQIVIGNAILAGEQVYNLSGLAGKATLIEGRFFSSLTQVSEFFNITVEQVILKIYDDNEKEWNYIPNETFTIQAVTSRGVVFKNPINSGKKIVFKSLREAEIVLQDFYRRLTQEQIEKYYSYDIKFSRREITRICNQDNNRYLYYEKNQDKRI